MATKDSSCLQGRERNALATFDHPMWVDDMYSGWSRLRGVQQGRCSAHKPIVHFSIRALIRIIWKWHWRELSLEFAKVSERLDKCFRWPSKTHKFQVTKPGWASQGTYNVLALRSPQARYSLLTHESKVNMFWAPPPGSDNHSYAKGTYLASMTTTPLGSLKGEIWYSCSDVADVIRAPLSSYFIL